MTTIARWVDDEMRRRRNNDETMGTAQPAGRIQCRRHHSSRRIGVGVKGSQGGGVGRESWGRIARTTHGRVRVTGFFPMMRCACLHA